MSTPLSHYERLGVASDADALTLRQAFRRQSKALHPDTTNLPAAEAALLFRQLKESYALLQDPDQRALYDASLADRSLHRPLTNTAETSSAQPHSDGWGNVGERRPLSGGEWWALLLLLLALAFCLVLGLGGAWARGLELQVQPSWMVAEQTSPKPVPSIRSDVSSAARPDTFESALIALP